MLTNTQHQAPDRRPSNSCDPDPHALPRYPTPYWSDTIAAFSNSLWLPNSTADHDSLINTTQSWDSKTAAHSWFSTNRIPAPDSELPKLYSSAAVQDSAIRATVILVESQQPNRGNDQNQLDRHGLKQQARPNTGYPLQLPPKDLRLTVTRSRPWAAMASPAAIAHLRATG